MAKNIEAECVKVRCAYARHSIEEVKILSLLNQMFYHSSKLNVQAILCAI